MSGMTFTMWCAGVYPYQTALALTFHQCPAARVEALRKPHGQTRSINRRKGLFGKQIWLYGLKTLKIPPDSTFTIHSERDIILPVSIQYISPHHCSINNPSQFRASTRGEVLYKNLNDYESFIARHCAI